MERVPSCRSVSLSCSNIIDNTNCTSVCSLRISSHPCTTALYQAYTLRPSCHPLCSLIQAVLIWCYPASVNYVVIFGCYIVRRASDKCLRERRKTINGDDLLWAMQTLGFEDYLEPLKIYLTKFREAEVCSSSNSSSSRSGWLCILQSVYGFLCSD